MREQVIDLGCQIMTEDATSVTKFGINFKVNNYITKSVIIATGATAKTLSVPNSNKYWNKGISACAVCDGALPCFRNKTLMVIGGGDTACEEALFLSKFGSEVYMLVRSGIMRASHMMKDQVLNNSKIKILYNTQLISVNGSETLESANIVNGRGEILTIPIAGLFYAIGHEPNSKFLNGLVETDNNGYIITNNTMTNIPGIYACGDVQDSIYRQAITAAGTGCIAALEVEKYLSTFK